MEPIRCPETSIINYHNPLRNNRQEHSPRLCVWDFVITINDTVHYHSCNSTIKKKKFLVPDNFNFVYTAHFITCILIYSISLYINLHFISHEKLRICCHKSVIFYTNCCFHWDYIFIIYCQIIFISVYMLDLYNFIPQVHYTSNTSHNK
jgi:hypothetical protein